MGQGPGDDRALVLTVPSRDAIKMQWRNHWIAGICGIGYGKTMSYVVTALVESRAHAGV